jgi:hypothetical protein
VKALRLAAQRLQVAPDELFVSSAALITSSPSTVPQLTTARMLDSASLSGPQESAGKIKGNSHERAGRPTGSAEFELDSF